MGYSRTLNYREIITLSDSTHMMSMIDSVIIGVETLRVNSGCSLKKLFIKLIYMNLLMILYLTVSQIDSCHDCVSSPLT